MLTIKSDFQDKCMEAKILINHIKELSGHQSSVQKVSILKSAFIVLLYNMMESTTTLIIERIHEKASRHKYTELSQELRLLFSEYYFKNQKANNIKEYLTQMNEGSLNFPVLSDFTNRIKLFSGNLDARELNSLLKKYGVRTVNVKGMDKLLEVKNKRNKLAHGELMFKEACRHLTLKELEKIQDSVQSYFSRFIDNSELYLRQEKYLINSVS